MTYHFTEAFARELDGKDSLKNFREMFHIPQHKGKDCIYLTGNSLGLQPKTARAYVEEEFLDWQHLGVEGHTEGKNAWLYYHHMLTENAAAVVGALPSEVVMMNNLTANLHFMLVSFYRPGPQRYKIMIEACAFPSDQYAVDSQAAFHGFDPKDTVVELFPREGEHTLRTEDILQSIEQHGPELALVMLGGVNYYTGQAFDMQRITAKAHAVGAVCGFDLAHAAGNLVLKLHDWDVDFAVWCSYKYLNSGPGGTAGIFVHEKHGENSSLPRFAGWWGHNEEERFLMKRQFKPIKGAQGWQLSNAQIFPMAIHRASLEIFTKAGMPQLRAKSEQLTGYLEYILKEISHRNKTDFRVITPTDPAQRGCQLSVLVSRNGKELYNFLKQQGAVTDWREPNVIRMAPVPLYNSFSDIYRLGELLLAFEDGSVQEA